ncbi:MAG: alpha/beta hydrolase [Anaerolineales bacterium]
MYNFKRPVLAIVLVIVLVVSSSACSPAPATQSVPISTSSNTEAAPVVSADTNDGNYSYIVNGNDKLPKLKRLFGEDTVLTLVVQDLAGNELLRIEDVYRKTTNLNELLGAGEYKALFYDETGALLTPSQEVDDILTLKDRGKADTTSPSSQNETKSKGDYTSTNLTYATEGSLTLKLNLIKPSAGNNFPVILWIHGGGFGPGGLNAAEGFEDDFTAEGYAIAAVAYRSMEEGYFPAQIQDLKGAIRYLRANASELNIDPDRIFILGTSSGGLLASLTGVTTDLPEYEGTTGGNENVSSSVAGVIDLFGSVTTAQIDDLSPDILPTTYEIFGCAPYGDCPDRYKLAINNYITANDPPFLILHGTEDATVPYQESVELAELLNTAGVSTTFVTAEGYGHDKDGIITAYFDEIISFLNGIK